MIFTVMENKQSVLFALNDFKKENPPEIPTILDQYLEFISKSGQTLFEWSYLKPLFLNKLDKVATEFYLDHPTDQYPPRPNIDNPSFNELKQRILKQIDQFQGTPFTIQRLCELVLTPRKYYKRPDKFMRGVERACMVVSMVDPFGNKIHSEDPRFACPVGSLPINGSDNELWAFSNIHSANSNSPPLENDEDDARTNNTDVQTDSTVVQTVRSVSNGSVAGGLHWVTAGPNSYEDDDDYDDSGTDNDEVDTHDQSSKPSTVSNESHIPDLHPSSSTPPSSEQLTVTVTLPVEAVGKLNDLSTTTTRSSPVSSPTSSDLRPIGQLEAFVQNVSESGGYVERLSRSVSPSGGGSSGGGFVVSGEEDDDISASPAKKRRLSPQSYSPQKLSNNLQSEPTSEVNKDLSEPSSSSCSLSDNRLSISQMESGESLSKDESKSDDLLPHGDVTPAAIDDKPTCKEVYTCEDQTESSSDNLINQESSSPVSNFDNPTTEAKFEISESSANSNPCIETSIAFRDEESGEMDANNAYSSSQSRSQSSNIDLETGEQE